MMGKSRLGGSVAAAFFALLMMTPAAASAATDLKVITSTNLTEPERDALTELFRAAYEEASRQPVHVLAPPARTPAADDEAPPAVVEPAAPQASEERVELSFVGLGERIQVRAVRVNAEGIQVHSVQTRLANLDEAPNIFARMAKALYELSSFQQTETLDNIAEEDTEKPKRKRSEFVGGVRTSMGAPMANGYSFGAYGTIGFDGRVEAGENVIAFGAGFGIPALSDNNMRAVGGMYFDIGYNRYLTKTNISPYLGMGVMPRIWGWGGYTGSGLNVLPYAQAGVMFLRDHKTRIYGEFRAGVNITPVGNGSSNTHPVELMGAVGVGF